MASTSSTKPVDSIPRGMHTVTPHLICAGAADAIEFYKKAFGAKENGRLLTPEGKVMHAQIKIGDSVIMLVDEMPQCGARGPKAFGGTPVTLHLYVNDVDAVFAQAVKAGAKPKMPVTDMFWGDRYGVIEDPFGHNWSIATHKRELTSEQIQEGAKAMCQ
jgi:PhnB protein